MVAATLTRCGVMADYLIELLGKQPAPRFCVVTPPGFPHTAVTDAILAKHNVVPVTIAPETLPLPSLSVAPTAKPNLRRVRALGIAGATDRGGESANY